ncbi:uncharacterized protein B0T15DRAFT_313890 [Chaetomium strumarium]|uniref:Mid2 domain-containing protein n=1 Tax=Chaetomium strumarium TaxID=1170767 RepID=A0AAJ0GN13_9PEZI|nr:hypothetical protein B0T15DRAFT_313890 [Chaetomium strumarium]
MASLKLSALRLSCAAISPLILTILLLSICAPAVDAQDSLLIDCYRWDGAVSPNNTKCPNSNACCGPKATCLSNRLCANPGDSPNLWIRGPCAVKGWDDGCAQICKYIEEKGLFPRVVPCADGSLCCNNDPQCCQNGKGIFLDESGEVASAKATAATTTYPVVSGGLSRTTLTPSTSTTSTSTTTTSSSSSSDASTTSTTLSNAAATTASSATPTPTPESTSDDDDANTGLKVGLGLGIPLAVIVGALLAYLFFRRRARHASNAVETATVTATATAEPPVYEQGMAQQVYYTGVPKQPGFHGTGNSPVEIMGNMATELDSNEYSPSTKGSHPYSPYSPQGSHQPYSPAGSQPYPPQGRYELS